MHAGPVVHFVKVASLTGRDRAGSLFPFPADHRPIDHRRRLGSLDRSSANANRRPPATRSAAASPGRRRSANQPRAPSFEQTVPLLSAVFQRADFSVAYKPGTGGVVVTDIETDVSRRSWRQARSHRSSRRQALAPFPSRKQSTTGARLINVGLFLPLLPLPAARFRCPAVTLTCPDNVSPCPGRHFDHADMIMAGHRVIFIVWSDRQK